MLLGIVWLLRGPSGVHAGRAARDAFSFFAPAVHINIGLARARGCGVVV